MQIVIDINEADKEIEKVFEHAFANYIITARTEGATATEFAERRRECGAECDMALKDKDEVIDKLLEYLVKYTGIGSDIPCEYLNGTNYCCENCKYDNPVKECWFKYAEEEVEAERWMPYLNHTRQKARKSND